jgi:hypothetical protein
MIAIEAGERGHDGRRIPRADTLHRIESPGAAKDLRLDLVQRALAGAGRAWR